MSWGWMTRGVGRKAFQSILPQGEWRHSPHSLAAWQQISIHTPTRGVTDHGHSDIAYTVISIHTPTRGVTGCGKYSTWPDTISIHTPTRGVTFTVKKLGKAVNTFQSTLPQGEWHIWLIIILAQVIFQSTLPQGEWPYNIDGATSITIFQSTLPQGEWQED